MVDIKNWRRGGVDNEWEIQVRSRCKFIDFLWEEYGWSFERIPILRLWLCIGLNVWGIVTLLFRTLICHDKRGMFLTIIPLAVVFSLLISTPVDAMYRYAYAVFCCFPFLLFANFSKQGIGS